MHKPIAIVSQDLKLKELVTKLDQLDEQFKEHIEFLKKKATQLKDEHDKNSAPVWKDIEALMRASGKLPSEYVAEKHHLHYMGDDDLLLFCDGDHSQHPLIELLKKL